MRDEVKKNLPTVFVPEWSNHYDLITILSVGGYFERNYFSIESQSRKKQYHLLMTERKKNKLPTLYVKINNDESHFKSSELYAKSNQFNFSQVNKNFDADAQSIYFEIYRDNGESLGVCSALTYIILSNKFIVLNWALSCRFFEIGLEEFILLYVKQLGLFDNFVIRYNASQYNLKVKDLMNKYQNVFSKKDSLDEFVQINLSEESINILNKNTNLKKY